jgi:hypothetical protein
MQADFLLYLRDAIDSIRFDGRRQTYFPHTLMTYSEFGDVFELFARAESQKYFDEIKSILGISSYEELSPLKAAIQNGRVFIPKWDWKFLNPLAMMNFEKLATKA